MPEIPMWEVDLFVDGPVAIRRRINCKQDILGITRCSSDIKIAGIASGFKATLTAAASDERLAFEAAVFFFGRMLDVLAFLVDRALYLSLTERRRSRESPLQQDVRRIIQQEEIEHAFAEVSWVQKMSPCDSLDPVRGTTTSSFLRSLGWYRKGLYTDDPFDKFLAFWNAIEVVASRYYRQVPSIDKERAKKGVKNQLWACFNAVWGDCQQWPIISGANEWIDESYEIRKDIAHGAGCVQIQQVASVASRLDVLRKVAHRFLKDWREKWLYVDTIANDQPRIESTAYTISRDGGMANLIAVEGPHKGERFPVKGTPSRIGRSADCSIRLRDKTVSRAHAEINYKDGAYYVEDLSSSTGTFINGQQLAARKSVRLSEQDKLQIGPFVFRLSTEESGTEEKREGTQIETDGQGIPNICEQTRVTYQEE